MAAVIPTDPLTEFMSGQILTGTNPFGRGRTASQQSGLYTGESSDPTTNEILRRIQSKAGQGTFNEGELTQALAEVRNLKNQLDAGKISQADYVKITDQFLPRVIQYGNQMAQTGSAGAKSVVPILNELNPYGTDLSIYKAGQSYLGRDLTAAEVAQLKPRFADGTDIGNAYVASLAEQEKNSPANLGKRAGQYSGQVNKTFQDLLSRGATQEEVDYFGRLLASGDVTPYEINAFVQQLPEYQNVQDKSFRSGLEGELAGYDEKAFARERENILSQYTRAGLQNSSALDFAITDALGKIQEQRGQYLAGLSSQQYGGNKAAARSDYENLRNTYQANNEYSRNRRDSYLDYLTQRADQGADYNRQKNDYLQFLQSQPRQSSRSPWGQLVGGIAGAGIGAFGGPAGASAGYQIGSGIGGGFDYLNY